MAQRGHGLVYGGGAQGLMGAAARGVQAYGGEIIGVAPRFFQVDGVLFDGCTEMIYTETMRQRKEIMEQKADAFCVVPGGIGTFEEFLEILTLKQLGRHKKPIVIYDINDYYAPMWSMLQRAIDQGFMKAACSCLYAPHSSAEALLTYLEEYQPDQVDVRHLKNI